MGDPFKDLIEQSSRRVERDARELRIINLHARPVAHRRRSRLRAFVETPFIQVSCWLIIFCAGVACGVFMTVAGS